MAYIEFECEKCGHKFDKLVYGDTDRSALTCPKCGSGVKQSFNGKCYGKIGTASGCSGDCKNCSGCHH